MELSNKYRVLAGISVVAILAAILAPRTPQDRLYHPFADQNAYLAIQNTLNILSNPFFARVGIEGRYRLLRKKSLLIVDTLYRAYLVFPRHLRFRRVVNP